MIFWVQVFKSVPWWRDCGHGLWELFVIVIAKIEVRSPSHQDLAMRYPYARTVKRHCHENFDGIYSLANYFP